jgi:hypothetical protein
LKGSTVRGTVTDLKACVRKGGAALSTYLPGGISVDKEFTYSGRDGFRTDHKTDMNCFVTIMLEINMHCNGNDLLPFGRSVAKNLDDSEMG